MQICAVFFDANCLCMGRLCNPKVFSVCTSCKGLRLVSSYTRGPLNAGHVTNRRFLFIHVYLVFGYNEGQSKAAEIVTCLTNAQLPLVCQV